MFELGLRLAFDKPTIIIKDDKTSYSFDTSPIEHLEYPRDLRFTKIVEFKKSLREKVQVTLKKSHTDPNYTTFLKHFGTFTLAKLDTKEVSKEDFIIEELKELKKIVHRQQSLYGERMHMIGRPILYGKFPAEKNKLEMRRAIKEAINSERLNFPISEINSVEMREAVFQKIITNEGLKSYFASPEEFELTFQEAFKEFFE